MVPILSSHMSNALMATILKLDSKGAGKYAWLLRGLHDEAFHQTRMVKASSTRPHRSQACFFSLANEVSVQNEKAKTLQHDNIHGRVL